jgi:hypothetical protein
MIIINTFIIIDGPSTTFLIFSTSARLDLVSARL